MCIIRLHARIQIFFLGDGGLRVPRGVFARRVAMPSLGNFNVSLRNVYCPGGGGRGDGGPDPVTQLLYIRALRLNYIYS